MSEDDPIVTIAHLRMAGMCSREPRAWMQRHGLNWNEFITNGYPTSVLLATGDSLALPAIEAARRRPDLVKVRS